MTGWPNQWAEYDHDFTVFLTIGLAKISGPNADAALLDTLGLRFRKLKTPIRNRPGESAKPAWRRASTPRDFGLEVLDCRESSTIGGDAR
jgi:hypothetical protein